MNSYMRTHTHAQFDHEHSNTRACARAHHTSQTHVTCIHNTHPCTYSKFR